MTDASFPSPKAPVRRRWPKVLAWVGVGMLALGLAIGLLAAGGVFRARRQEAEGPPRLPTPVGFTGEVSEGIVRLDWESPRGIEGTPYFEVFRDGMLVGTVTNTAWTDSPSVGDRHEYRVRTMQWRNGQSNLVSDKTAAVWLRVPGHALAAAVLTGDWLMTEDLESSSARWRLRDHIENWGWSFVPTCSAGPCDVIASMPWGRSWYQVRLRHLPWGAWAGSSLEAPFRCRDGTAARFGLYLSADAGAYSGGRWVVDSLNGTARVRYPNDSDCRYAYASWSLSGEYSGPLDEQPSSG